MAQQGTAKRSKEAEREREREAIIKVTNFMDSSSPGQHTCTSMLVCVCVCLYNGIYELSEITFALLGVAYVDPSGLLPVPDKYAKEKY